MAKKIELSLYEMQSCCHSKGFKCSFKPVRGKALLVLLKDGKVFREGDIENENDYVKFTDLPKAYAQKYEAMYRYFVQMQPKLEMQEN